MNWLIFMSKFWYFNGLQSWRVGARRRCGGSNLLSEFSFHKGFEQGISFLSWQTISSLNAVLLGGRRFVRWRGGSGVWSRFGSRRLGIRRRVIGGLFVGGADGFAPGIGVVGVDVFVLGEGQDLD